MLTHAEVLPFIALGLTSVVTQIILLREFLSVFYGNELVIGIILANWMVLTGAGALIGRMSKEVGSKVSLLVLALCFIAILPPLTVFFLRYSRNLVFAVGSMIGIIQVLWSSFLLMMPYCLLSGFLFTYMVRAISRRHGSNATAMAYSLEAAGSVAGGILFNLLLVHFLKTFTSLLMIAFIDLGIAFWIAATIEGVSIRLGIAFLLIASCATTFGFNVDDVTKGFLFKDQEVLYYRDTPYGNLAITQQGDQRNFYENDVLLFSTSNTMWNEEAVHYAMIQHPHPLNVLLISGGISGTTSEILKYNVDRIDYVELNPWILEVGKRFTSALSDPRIHLINEDARFYVRTTTELYDIALINVPDPSTTQLNRFYTVEFFRELKQKLSAGGVISLALLPAEEYVSHQAGDINSIMVATLRTAFRNVLIVPGMRNYFLASDSSLDLRITQMVTRRGIENRYVNQYYLDDRILEQRSADIVSHLSQSSQLNTDFSPVSYYRQLLYWLSYFGFNPWIFGWGCLGVLIAIGIQLNPISVGIFTGGFAASSIEILLIIAFQILYGFAYQAIGAIITIFMTGLAVGSFLLRTSTNVKSVRGYAKIQFGIGIFSVLLPALFLVLKSVPPSGVLMYTLFFVLTFMISLLIGMEFAIAAGLRHGNPVSVASELYGIDLVGSAAGALMVSAFLIPWIGVSNVSYLTGALSVASGIVWLVKGKRYLVARPVEVEVR